MQPFELRFRRYQRLLDVGDTLYAPHEHQALLGRRSQLQDLLREPAALPGALLDLLLELQVRRADLLELP